ncbi:hypothetical protein CMQ_6934 [Grosmannia clavigera kw1407]|uniref:Uncharacterized protein n=1 Tax=Grosmannia clavigera (strain kw1407 / UAMH 11150) TaxID=655863 RepID=F0X7I4_GROCL|nr:uncharacterized protein CMQ_6934 [Grosmannia clavigera kw1407]EFX06613.1 hypothetical protein CMQ_6934 [Grosmannia clavigera kw1407]
MLVPADGELNAFGGMTMSLDTANQKKTARHELRSRLSRHGQPAGELLFRALLQQTHQLLLLSFAGPDLTHHKALPCHVDIQAEMKRTSRELRALGLCNEDVCIHSCAWNEEVWRVMYFTFDQAYFESSEPGTPESLESSKPAKMIEPSDPRTLKVELLAGPSELPVLEPAKPPFLKDSSKYTSGQQVPSEQTRSPSPAKRDWTSLQHELM